MIVEPTRANVHHLLTRSAFVATRAEVAAGIERSIEDTVSLLLDTRPNDAPSEPDHDPADDAEILITVEALANWFFRLCVSSPTPAIERLTWFWTGHFSNNAEAVEFPQLVLQQFVMLRNNCLGNFNELMVAITLDPAMNLFLDLETNTADSINENYARECLELFTMGVDNGYTQRDVVEVSRALTGIGLRYSEENDERPAATRLIPERFDAGAKTILGQTGHFGLSETMSIITAQPETHGFIASRLWHRYAGTPIPADVREHLASVFARQLSILDVTRAMLTHPAFYSDDVRNGLVASPVETIVRAYRGFGLDVRRSEFVSTETYDVDPCLEMADAMGQVPGLPPNVGGWPHNEAWLDSTHSSGRIRAAKVLAEELVDSNADAAQQLITATTPADVRDSLANGLGVFEWSGQTAAALDAASTIRDEQERIEALLVLALTSPEVTLS